MIRACIFDLDGTLMNTIGTITHYLNAALGVYGFAPFEEDRVKYFVGSGARLLVERALAAHGVLTEENFRAVFETYNALYDAAPNEGSAPYDGILDMLAALTARGVRVGVLSNKPDFATRAVVSSFFGDLVTVAHGGREGIPLKPAPDGVREILREMSVSPCECLYIGDTGVDMETGRAAGIPTVGVLWGFRSREELEAAEAVHIIAHPRELLPLVSLKM